MQFYNAKDIPPFDPSDVIFRYSRWQNLSGVFIISMVIAVSFWQGTRGDLHFGSGHMPGFICYLISGSLAFFALLTFPPALACLRPENWVTAANSGRVMVKFRSHLNRHFEVGDIQVFSVQMFELESVQHFSEDHQSADFGRNEYTRFYYLCLELKNKDTQLLERYLEEERARRAPKIGCVSTRYNTDFVIVQKPGFIRIVWNGIEPGLGKAYKIINGGLK